MTGAFAVEHVFPESLGMFETLRAWLAGLLSPARLSAIAPIEEPAPDCVVVEGAKPFSIAAHLVREHGLPHLDWDAAEAWCASLPEDAMRGLGWARCEVAWLLHLRDALGGGYRLRGLARAALLSNLPASLADAALRSFIRIRRDVTAALGDLAEVPPFGSDILLVLDDHHFFDYTAHFFPERGAYAASGGFFLSAGCSHIALRGQDLTSIETAVAHELAHAYTAHLPLPGWLNEGIALHMERGVTARRPEDINFGEVLSEHAEFWGEEEMQELWSGVAFYRPDDGSRLAYDLSRRLLTALSRDRAAFIAFAQAADCGDAGAKAAREYLGCELGEVVAEIIGVEEAARWGPNPSAWRALGEAQKREEAPNRKQKRSSARRRKRW